MIWVLVEVAWAACKKYLEYLKQKIIASYVKIKDNFCAMYFSY